MRIPTLQGIIDRRILINYQVDPTVLSTYLPTPFQPQLVNDKGIAGICLIRLKNIRPKGFPSFLGVQSENGAHRIAVKWVEDGVEKTGVYIPRRDTSAQLNVWAGGFVFPGVHHLAEFAIKEENQRYEVSFISEDDTQLAIQAQESGSWNDDSVFKNIEEASAFFENGCLGYSPAKNRYDGLLLKTYTWKVKPLSVQFVRSSFFDNTAIFPDGSVQFDNALLMKNIVHEWKTAPVFIGE